MKEYEIAHALTDVSDELLLEAAQAGQRRNRCRYPRIAVVAAIVAMLALTVGAVSLGVTWKVEAENKTGEGLALGYYKDYDGSLDFDKLEYSVPLGVVELPNRTISELRNILYRCWHLTQQEEYAAAYDTIDPNTEFVFDSWELDSYMESYISRYGMGQKLTPSFRTLADAEVLLGINLEVPNDIREAVRNAAEAYGAMGLCVRIYTGKTVAEAAELNGSLEPTKIVISYKTRELVGNGTVYGSITIPLTEEAAQSGIQGLHYSYEKEGAIWQEEQTIGKRAVVLFGNDPDEGYKGWCEAIYIQDGIGYAISADRDADIPYYSPSWPYYDSAKAIVLSLLANGE